MKSKTLLSLVTIAAIGLGLTATAAKANSRLDELCSRYPYNRQCEDYVPSTNREANRDPDTGFVVINNKDWRTSEDVPFSEPIIVNDPFDGNYLAVLDKNFSGRLALGTYQEGVITNWSERYIRVYAYTIQKPCSGVELFCPHSITVHETSNFEVKVGDEVFRLEGENGNFNVTPELAIALRNAPPGKAITRISLEGSGSQIVNDIGAGTTEAWHTVYKNAGAQSDIESAIPSSTN